MLASRRPFVTSARATARASVSAVSSFALDQAGSAALGTHHKLVQACTDELLPGLCA